VLLAPGLDPQPICQVSDDPVVGDPDADLVELGALAECLQVDVETFTPGVGTEVIRAGCLDSSGDQTVSVGGGAFWLNAVGVSHDAPR
jgi:translation initiation factor 6 (eIF-6)